MKLGIAGTGMIAQEFLSIIDNLDITDVWMLSTKRSEQRVKQLVEQYHLNGYVVEYEKLLLKEIDTVYIALPNHLHYVYAKQALLSGKHVIIEKPAVTSIAEWEELWQLAQEKNLFLFEAMSLYHLPAYKKLKEDIIKIGKLKIISFNYSQYSSRYDAFKEGKILPAFDVHKAGGALMDINVYNLHAVLGLCGMPQETQYQANIEKEIDTSGILTMNYGSYQAVCIGAKDCGAPVMLSIQGDEGTIVIYTPINGVKEYQVIDNAGNVTEYKDATKCNRLQHEFEEYIKMIEEKDYASAEELAELSHMAAEILEKSIKQVGINFDI